MEVTSIQKYIHSTPRKLRLVTDMVRKMEPGQALEALKFADQAAAKDLSAAIKTALANAKVKGMEQVTFKTVEINEGPKMKRFRAGTRGRAKPYKKRMSHIKIILTDDLSEKGKVKREKLEKEEK